MNGYAIVPFLFQPPVGFIPQRENGMGFGKLLKRPPHFYKTKMYVSKYLELPSDLSNNEHHYVHKEMIVKVTENTR